MKSFTRFRTPAFFLIGVFAFHFLAQSAEMNLECSAESWSSKVIGNPNSSGEFTFSNGIFRLGHSRSKSDQITNGFQFVYRPVNGNSQIIARVMDPLQGSSSTAGVMIRENLAEDSRFASVSVVSNGDILFERRLVPGEKTISTIVKSNGRSGWVRLVGEGSSFSGFSSDDGTNWIQFSADTVEMTKDVFAGLTHFGSGESALELVQLASARITSPAENARFTVPTNILLNAEITSSGSQPRRVEFFADAKKIGEANGSSSLIVWSNALADSHLLFAKISGAGGAEFFTEPVSCKITLPPAGAELIGEDAVTKGDWRSRYGQEGFCVVRHATNYPAYAEISSKGHKSVLLTHSSQPNALQLTNGNGGICAQWFTYTNMTVNISVRDGYSHQVAFYFHDFDSDLRAQQIEVIDSATRAVLDTRKISNFHGGKYLLWNVRGAVQFRITALAGNAVINGIFFDPNVSSNKPSRE